MPLARETIYAALFARLQARVTLCTTFSRKWLSADKVGIDQQPALLCLEGDEIPRDDPTLPPVWTLEAQIVVYARTNDTPTPGKVLSNILDQIEGALERDNESVISAHFNTSLGLPLTVERAWIAGPVEKEDGALTNGQGWISVPIHILAIP